MSGMKMNQTPQKSSKILELIQKIREAKDPLDILLNYDYLLDEIEGQYNGSRFGRRRIHPNIYLPCSFLLIMSSIQSR